MSLNPDYLYRGKVIRVLDGDTVDIDVDLGFYLRATIRFRLADIDAPELNSSDLEVRKAAQASTDYLFNLIRDNAVPDPTMGSLGSVTLKSLKTEKYGRWLAILYLGTIQVNLAMVEAGHAVPYSGGAR